MAKTEDSLELEVMQPAKSRPAPGGMRFDWIVSVLCTILVGGIYLDGWAHAHGKVDGTFFTPWHAVLYSGFAIAGAFLVLNLLRNRVKGYPWLEALPPGYSISLLGVIIFAVGGVLDLIWHILFGIEMNVDALLSPTHLMLALGVVLMVTGPLRAAWLRFPTENVAGQITVSVVNTAVKHRHNHLVVALCYSPRAHGADVRALFAAALPIIRERPLFAKPGIVGDDRLGIQLDLENRFGVFDFGQFEILGNDGIDIFPVFIFDHFEPAD